MTTPEIEAVARALEPLAWAALGLCDTKRHEATRRSSLYKAARVFPAIRPMIEAAYRAGIINENRAVFHTGKVETDHDYATSVIAKATGESE